MTEENGIILLMIFGAFCIILLAWVFWFVVSEALWREDQSAQHELDRQAMTKGTSRKGSVTCLRDALDI